MTGKGIVNLINRLRKQGIPSDEILDTIVYIETADPQTELMYGSSENSNDSKGPVSAS